MHDPRNAQNVRPNELLSRLESDSPEPYTIMPIRENPPATNHVVLVDGVHMTQIHLKWYSITTMYLYIFYRCILIIVQNDMSINNLQ